MKFVKFCYRFDPTFNASVYLLISQAANPTSEFEQSLYNEFIQMYGTHYVSHVIVGGVAYLYTFVGENYHTIYTHEDMTFEISLMAQYNGFSSETGTKPDDSDIYQQIAESFKDNSYPDFVFQPPITRVTNRSMIK